MYDRNCSVIVFAWKPFKHLLKLKGLRRQTTLIQTFSTFILHLSIKIIEITVVLLTKARAYDQTGKEVRKVLHIDASIKYFGPEHRLVEIFGILIFFIFALMHYLLLFIYPCKLFQKLVNLFGNIIQLFHIYMDTFQGVNKTKPVDWRFFFCIISYFTVFMPVHNGLLSVTHSTSYYMCSTLMHQVSYLL